MSSRRSQRSTRAAEPVADVILVRPTRSRRTVSENSATATVSRGPATNRSPQSMRLTVKASSSKLREATRSASGKVSVGRDAFVGGEILEGKRERKVRKSYVLESESEPEASEEVEEEDEEMDDVGDEDAEGEEDDEEMEDDGLGDEDADGDIDMDEPPPPPVIRISKAQSGKQTIVAKPAKSAKADSKTVEQTMLRKKKQCRQVTRKMQKVKKKRSRLRKTLKRMTSLIAMMKHQAAVAGHQLLISTS
jgi:Ino eighty subunit 2